MYLKNWFFILLIFLFNKDYLAIRIVNKTSYTNTGRDGAVVTDQTVPGSTQADDASSLTGYASHR